MIDTSGSIEEANLQKIINSHTIKDRFHVIKKETLTGKCQYYRIVRW